MPTAHPATTDPETGSVPLREPWTDLVARERVARADALLAGLDTLASTAAARQAAETVEALVALYGECLARIMHHLADAAGGELTGRLAADELIGHLLLVHDLHPDPVSTRVRRAVEQVHAQAAPRGGLVELLELYEAEVRVRLSAAGCGSSSAALEQAVTEAVTQAAPEIEKVTVVAGEPQALIPVDALFRGGPAGPG